MVVVVSVSVVSNKFELGVRDHSTAETEVRSCVDQAMASFRCPWIWICICVGLVLVVVGVVGVVGVVVMVDVERLTRSTARSDVNVVILFFEVWMVLFILVLYEK
mgnify:CR=1 FL=1